MIVLEYLFDSDELKKLDRVDLEKVTGTQLDYYLFCGSITFRADSISFDAPWRWIPLLDFGIKINEIAIELRHGKIKALEFTESEATITFRRKDDEVLIETNYCPGKATVLFVELQIAARTFLERLKTDLLQRYPTLAHNTFFRERLEHVDIV